MGLKYWETIADNLGKAGWTWGCVASVDREGRTIWVVAAERDGQRFIVHADEKLTALLNLNRRLALAANCLDNRRGILSRLDKKPLTHESDHDFNPSTADGQVHN